MATNKLDLYAILGTHQCDKTYGRVNRPSVQLTGYGLSRLKRCTSYRTTAQYSREIAKNMTIFNADPSPYRYEKDIGRGTYGQVYQFMKRTVIPGKTRSCLAVKIMYGPNDARTTPLTVLTNDRKLREIQRLIECPIVYTCVYRSPENPSVVVLVMEMGMPIIPEALIPAFYTDTSIRLNYALKIAKLVACLAQAWTIFPDIKAGNLVVCVNSGDSRVAQRKNAEIVAIDVDGLYTLRAPTLVDTKSGPALGSVALSPQPTRMPVATHRCKELQVSQSFSERNAILVSYLAAIVTILTIILPKSGYFHLADDEADSRSARFAFHAVLTSLDFNQEKLSPELGNLAFVLLEKLRAFSTMFEKNNVLSLTGDPWEYLTTNMYDIIEAISPVQLLRMKAEVAQKRRRQFDELLKARPRPLDETLNKSFESLLNPKYDQVSSLKRARSPEEQGIPVGGLSDESFERVLNEEFNVPSPNMAAINESDLSDESFDKLLSEQFDLPQRKRTVINDSDLSDESVEGLLSEQFDLPQRKRTVINDSDLSDESFEGLLSEQSNLPPPKTDAFTSFI